MQLSLLKFLQFATKDFAKKLCVLFSSWKEKKSKELWWKMFAHLLLVWKLYMFLYQTGLAILTQVVTVC